jgi:hypothetical protein
MERSSAEIAARPREIGLRLLTMPSELFRTSTTWVVDFRYDGHPRRWFKVFGAGINALAPMSAELRQLYGNRAQLVEVRRATDEEEALYLRGEAPKNIFCPTGRC